MWIQVNQETKRIEGCIESCLGKPIAKNGCVLVEVDEIPANWQYCNWDGEAVLDKAFKQEKFIEEQLREIRIQREIECFPYINRGSLWYEMLTDAQKEELKAWYQAWLDAPQTKIIPARPIWLE